MKLVFAGTPDVAVASLRALVDSRHEVAAVISRPDAAVGRSSRLVPSPVAQAADELGIPVFKPARVTEVLDDLRAIAPDVCPVVAYGALVPRSVLDVPTHGWVNVHFSLLPAWRGAAPVQRALMAGETELGITTFQLVEALDAGPIYRQLTTPALPDEVAGEALTRLAVLGADLLVETLDAIDAGEQPVAQPDADTTYAAKITPDEARIDWSLPADSIANLVRGTSPNPGAWSELAGQRFKVLRAHVGASDDVLAPGELRSTKRELLVGSGDGVLVLDEVQAFGKKAMRGADWARGANLEAGARLA